MKSLLASLSIAVASSSAIAAPNIAEPAAAVAPAATPAPSAEQIALARRFVGLTVTADSYMEATRFGFMSSTVAQLEGIETEKGFDEAETKVGKVFDKIEPKLRERLPNLFEAYAQAYAQEFSADELRQLVAFAASPAGQHYLSSYEFVEEDEAVVKATQGMWDAAMPVMEEFQKEMCAEKAAQRIAMGDTKAKCPLAAAAETAAG